MAKLEGLDSTIKKIGAIFNDYSHQAEQTAKDFSQRALREFQSHQFSAESGPAKKVEADTVDKKDAARKFAAAYSGVPKMSKGIPWINRSFRAARSVHAVYNGDDKQISFGLYHTMSYGAYLELGNNRRYAILEPIVRGLAGEFIEAIKGIYAG
jgi:hypothetical protein